jgi:glycosyltransferase involved in cell wall biosynthesis
MKIAMFAHNYLPHPGGLEVMVWNLARRLADRHEVVLVSSSYGTASGVAREQGMEVHRLPASHLTEGMGVPYPVPFGAGVRAAMHAASGADVVHAHGALYLQTLMARRVARRSRAPLVLTEHVGFVRYARPALNAVQGAAWRAIGDGTLERCAEVVTYNARVHAWLEQRAARTVRYVGNGVDLERFRRRDGEERRALRRSFGLPEDEVIALFVGRDAGKKNLDVVLEAPREGFVLATCGAQRKLRGDALCDLGIVPYERMPDLFGCVDVMVHPASGEGFPLAVQEAIAAGVPVVLLWDEGYARSVPRDVVVACDEVNDVAPALAALARDGARRAALSARGREWATRHWSWAATVAAYEEIYHAGIAATR